MQVAVTPDKPVADWQISLYAAIVAFLTYTTVYGFRKTFTVATFDDHRIFGLGYKEILVITQAIGYISSKFYGIRFISELKRSGRWKTILLLVGISWIAWFCFAIVPLPYNFIFLFLNGFPLGLLWGIIFSYIEGRRATDFIGTAMAVSFIFSSGLVKSIGKWLIVDFNVSEIWMPFIAGCIFIPFLLLFVLLLERVPGPSVADEALRSERKPMSGSDRILLLRKFLPGIALLVLLYVCLTIFRDIRDNFIADIWKDLGYISDPALFTMTEIPITIFILFLLGAMMFIRNNFSAFMVSHVIILIGFLIAGISTFLFTHGMLQPFYWIVVVGIGLYMGYIPYNCILFERLIAAFRISGNVGFLMYLADSFGYLGSLSVITGKVILVYMNFKIRWVDVFSSGVIILSCLGVLGTIVSAYYFYGKKSKMSFSYE